MGRELKRKEAKRNGRNVKKAVKIDNSMTPKTFGIIITVMLFFFLLLYLFTAIFVTKEIKWFSKDNKSSSQNIVSNSILAIDSLKQKESTYYVYYFDTKNPSVESDNIINMINEKVYKVDLSDGFNSNFVGTSSGIVEDINSLKVESPTLIKVTNSKIVEFYNGQEEIKKVLQ